MENNSRSTWISGALSTRATGSYPRLSKPRMLGKSLVVLCALSWPLPAQTVTGTVNDEARRAVAGAVVILLDSTGSTIARALGSDDGGFRVRAPAAGRYQLRVLRVGYRPAVIPTLVVGTNEMVRVEVSLRPLFITLDAVTVEGRQLCRLQEDSASSTFGLWSQARAGLEATSTWPGQPALLSLIVGYERVLDPGTLRIREQSIASRADSQSVRWRGASTDSLHRVGYVVVRQDSIEYLAPGLDMLASDRFVEDHCFSIAPSSDSMRIGISFQPTPARRRVPEIAGTLWLERRTNLLTSAEFRYLNLGRLESRYPAGGEIEFSRLADGSWSIVRWMLRMPVMSRTAGLERTARGVRASNRLEVLSIKEVGAHLVRAHRGGVILWEHYPIRLYGILVDSATGQPVVAAKVSLPNMESTDISDDAGRFRLGAVAPGHHTLEVRTASLDSLYAVQRMTVLVTGDSADVRVGVTSAQHLAQAVCRPIHGQRADATVGMVVGSVHTAAKTTRAGISEVVVQWQDASSKTTRVMRATSTEHGRFRFCGVPRATPVQLYARSEAGEIGFAAVTIQPNESFAAQDLVLETPPATTTFTGKVVDSTGRALSDVDVALPAVNKRVITDSTGTFRFSEVPIAENRLVVRKLGWGMLDTTISFVAGLDHRTIVLSRVTTMAAVETRATRRLAEFEEHRRLGLGHFVTEEDIEREKPLQTAQLLSSVPGLQLVREGNRAFAVTSRGSRTLTGIPCGTSRGADVYIDNVLVYKWGGEEKPFDINLIDPTRIAGIEFYSGPAQTPARYQNLNTICGVLVIWTR